MSIAEFHAAEIAVDGPETRIIEGFDLHARAGEVIGLSGPSASGKTTLVYALGGLSPIADGQLLVDGRPVTPWRDVTTGIVFQNLCLVPMLSAEETVALPLQSAGVAPALTREFAVDALSRLGLADHVTQLVGTLSGGQRQRVAVARCLAATPDLVLVDEPTSALDEQWREVVLSELVAQARLGSVVIIASGDAEVTAVCDRVIELAPAAVS